jgi:hypothetical protein
MLSRPRPSVPLIPALMLIFVLAGLSVSRTVQREEGPPSAWDVMHLTDPRVSVSYPMLVNRGTDVGSTPMARPFPSLWLTITCYKDNWEVVLESNPPFAQSRVPELEGRVRYATFVLFQFASIANTEEKKGRDDFLLLPDDYGMAVLAERGGNPKWGFTHGALDNQHPGDKFLKQMLEYDQVAFKTRVMFPEETDWRFLERTFQLRGLREAMVSIRSECDFGKVLKR